MRLWRDGLVRFLHNSLGFLFWTGGFIRRAHVRGPSPPLALLPTSASAVHLPTALFTGGLWGRRSRSALARWATVMSIAVCAASVYVRSLSLLYVMAPLLGLAGSIYWPSIQGAVGAESEPSQVERSIGWLNVSWSIGKTLS